VLAAETPKLSPGQVPRATYRVQFNHLFGFSQAAELVDYLDHLGITDYYASPVLAARPGSLHGYDVVDHSRINPELGTSEELSTLGARLRKRSMGLVLDVVPNHTCIAGALNQWWLDILENGPSSPYATFFDIDWHPPKQNLDNKVLLPMLGNQYGRVLENGEIQLSYQRGTFLADYYEIRLPVAPRTTIPVLNAILSDASVQLDEANPFRQELESIITALEHLPPRTETDPERVKERRREKEIIKRRLSSLVTSSNEIRKSLKKALRDLNGEKDKPDSLDRLEELLAYQAYRLCYWRVASDEINYRRFFDINDLAAIRVEDPKVFEAVHELIFQLMKEGVVTGLRIDHIDGLYDPDQYLIDVQEGYSRAVAASRRSIGGPGKTKCYVVVEKILNRNEQLREGWQAHGTTGYEFLNLLNGLFVDTRSESTFRKIYQRFTGHQESFLQAALEAKKLILRVAMPSELYMLARKLDHISEQHRASRDFTLRSLEAALAEVIACFPVYRSYIRPNQASVDDEDRRLITNSIATAKRHNPATDVSVFDFIGSLLLLEDPPGATDEGRAERREFVLRLQQLTGPVAAKGVEDTAFYRHYPLASLCEVGGDPTRFGVSPGQFHAHNKERLRKWPDTMLATSTHDTKRSEDTRARINVLSEIPSRWYRAIRRWESFNYEKKHLIHGLPAPDSNEEYLLYQTLIGTWPLDNGANSGGRNGTEYVNRIQQYMIKALREAKVHSSWLSPNLAYEEAVSGFIERILAPDSAFVTDFVEFQQPVARSAFASSLSQTLLKITVPGVPDFYQGTELWDYSLVDPDNRRPIDYDVRQKLLESLQASNVNAEELMSNPRDGRIKLFVTSRALGIRRSYPDLFARGDYVPAQVMGDRKRNVIAFGRRLGGNAVIVIATRFALRSRLVAGMSEISNGGWGNTAVTIDSGFAGCYRDAFTGRDFCNRPVRNACLIPMAQVCDQLPMVLLERVSGV
jgi:(1->4)-alpha-D-glucan 1-alpha-D-glucosylmutase